MEIISLEWASWYHMIDTSFYILIWNCIKNKLSDVTIASRDGSLVYILLFLCYNKIIFVVESTGIFGSILVIYIIYWEYIYVCREFENFIVEKRLDKKKRTSVCLNIH